MYEYERQREMLNMQFQSPEQQQPFHQFISEPADPFCRVTCHVHVEPIYEPPPRVDPVWLRVTMPEPEPVRFEIPWYMDRDCVLHGVRCCSACF